jgi:hypothetical protein
MDHRVGRFGEPTLEACRVVCRRSAQKWMGMMVEDGNLIKVQHDASCAQGSIVFTLQEARSLLKGSFIRAGLVEGF